MARYGGDEFAILLVETPKAGASCSAERIRQALGDYPFSHPPTDHCQFRDR
jgi:PleD family two-component response regulator